MTYEKTTNSELTDKTQYMLNQQGEQEYLSLHAVSEINEKMKHIVLGSNRLYVISLNAMFASRSITQGANGFVEVTALLRDFSHRLDIQVGNIIERINDLTYQSALIMKKQRLNRLLYQAIDQSDGVTVPESVLLNSATICEEINEITEKFTLLLSRCEKFVKVGENLAVLAKVEAAASIDGGLTLSPITVDMADTIFKISDDLLDSQNIIAV